MTDFSSKTQTLSEWSFRLCGAAHWEDVRIPHTPFVTDPEGGPHWQGLCEYRRCIRAENPQAGESFALHFHGAMHTARVLLDGVELARHSGGYLPFEVDVTQALADGAEHELIVVLDNRDAPDVPPGKPLAELDFCWFGGLYRPVELRRLAALHISDAATAGLVAGGGVFVRTIRADGQMAELAVRVHVCNGSAKALAGSLEMRVLRGDVELARGIALSGVLEAGTGEHVSFSPCIANPALWSPDSPALHTLELTLRGPEGEVLDRRCERFGIRTLKMSRSGGLEINGRRVRPRGTNRHQDHPYAGYALPAAAQRRDAVRIKEAGFDYVRLSHYPQSPDFLDACDELGILVMNCIPGWQYCGGAAFEDACAEAARELVRRDRNHPCVILWELSLNETQMSEAFMERMRAIGHEEFPGGQMFTCGWMDAYDVFIHARQHGRIHSWLNGERALVVSEYGDWEFYAENEGFDQATGAGLLPEAHNSRARRIDGEAKLLRQAENFAIALDDTLSSPAICDGQWAMFDYPRGYNPRQAACGVMDHFRLPKYAYHFYRSQRDIREGGPGWRGGVELFIASDWMPGSSPIVRVFSNAEEVELFLDGVSLGRERPMCADYPHLPYPPFEFDAGTFRPGQLRALAYVGGRSVAEHIVRSHGEPVALHLWADTLGISPDAADDLLFLHAELRDVSGSICVCSGALVELDSCPPGWRCVGAARVETEAGVASFVVRGSGRGSFTAHSGGLAQASLRL